MSDINDTLKARNGVHGDFAEDAHHAQQFKHIMHVSPNWAALTYVQREALEHIATKIGRILVGDPNHPDHWEDIQGYAKLVEQSLMGGQSIEQAVDLAMAKFKNPKIFSEVQNARTWETAADHGQGGEGDQEIVAGG